MTDTSETELDSAIYAEILRNTDKKTYNLTERLLRKTMVELVKSNRATFLFLKDDECRKWWDKAVADATATVNDLREQWRIYDIKKTAWDRLSEDDRKTLGIRKPGQPRRERV